MVSKFAPQCPSAMVFCFTIFQKQWSCLSWIETSETGKQNKSALFFIVVLGGDTL
jgi:hypothetical protein